LLCRGRRSSDLSEHISSVIHQPDHHDTEQDAHTNEADSLLLMDLIDSNQFDMELMAADVDVAIVSD